MKYKIFFFLFFVLIFSCKTKKDINIIGANDIDTLIINKHYYYLDFKNAYNVKDFGAKGNGLNDDTKAILSCFNKIDDNGGGIAYFPKGTYKISRTEIKGKSWCLLAVNNLTVVGEDRNKTQLKLSPEQLNYTRLLSLDNVENVIIKNITFNGNVFEQKNPGKPNEHLSAVFINCSGNVDIKYCKFINTGGDGITIRGINTPSKNINISNCYFNNNQRNGITLGSGFDNIKIKKCYFGKQIDDSPIDSEPESGICKNVYIQNNYIYTPTILSIGGNKNVVGKNFIFQNNNLYNCSIFIYKSDSVLIRNNNITNHLPKRAAITLLGENQNIIIDRNSIETNNKPAFYLVRTRFNKYGPKNIFINYNNFFDKNTRAFDIRGTNEINIFRNVITGNNNNTAIYCFSNFPIKNIKINDNIINGFITGIKINPLKTNKIQNIHINNNTFQKDIKTGIDIKYHKQKEMELLKNINIKNNIFSKKINTKVNR